MTKIFEIGPFRLDPEAGVLTREGRPTELGQRAVSVLRVLVEHANEHVSKNLILDAAWPGVVVEEGNLAVQIAAIRRVLERAGCRGWVETLHRRGYRFGGPVTVVRCGPDAKPPAEVERSNLPVALTTFVGRERELVEIKRLLAAKRLVTIGGPGGIGKTRLALQAAAEVVDAYRDGAWLVGLESVGDPRLVATTVAQALGIQESANVPVLDTLCARLRGSQLLLVLDNCEHLLDACAEAATAVLRSAREVTVIATSREPLAVDGEQIYTLKPLSLPKVDAAPEDVERAEAAQLLIARIRQQDPDFDVTPAQARFVAELCIRLDGIPLALELAAARVRSLSLEQITARLDDRFRLLQGGSRNLQPRQQALRATLDWSHELLGDEERKVLRRLAVFPDTFTLEAGADVAAMDDLDPLLADDLIGRLVSRSLVMVESSDGRARYRLLETTRVYAKDRLAEAGEAEACRRRHAEFFRRMFDRAPRDWLHLPTLEWSRRYLGEAAQVRAALEWAFGASGDLDLARALTAGSGPLWGALGLYSEGLRWVHVALERAAAATPTLEEARCCLWTAWLGPEHDSQSRSMLERASYLYREVGDAVGEGLARAALGRTLATMGHYDAAERELLEARRLFEPDGPPRAISTFHFHYGFLKASTGEFESARRHYEQSLTIDRATGEDYWAVTTVGNLANVNWGLGDLDAAIAGTRRQISMLRAATIPNAHAVGWAQLNLAAQLTQIGELAEALAVARESLPCLLDNGSAWVFMDHLALRAALTGDAAAAARLAGYADHSWVAHGAARQPIEARARSRLEAWLNSNVPPDDVARWEAEGADLDEAAACDLALHGSGDT